MIDLLSIGEPMVEFSALEDGELSVGQLFQLGFGGDTSNVVVAASRLGLKSKYLTRIGNDILGEALLKMWRKENVDTDSIIIEEGSFTGIYIIVRNNGRHRFIYLRKDSAASHLSPQDVDASLFRNLKAFQTSSITQAISSSSCDAVFRGIEMAKENKVLVTYDPNVRTTLWSIERARSIVRYTISLVDVVMLSMEDAVSIFGKMSKEEYVKKILNMGSKIVALKIGSDGCLIGDSEKLIHIPSYKPSKPIVDTSGAGDAFDAAFIYGLLNRWDLATIGVYANIAGALTSTRVGCTLASPYKEEIEKEFNLVKGVVANEIRSV
jgi:2-dehydro-3-deoxygluconokinase